MSAQVDYHLSIRVETPKTAIEGEPFKVTYHILNIGENVFPGGQITVRVTFSQLGGISGTFANYPIQIESLQPNEEFTFHPKEDVTPLASGYTMFQVDINPQGFVQIEGGRVFLHLEDRRPLDQRMIFGSVRARSPEEISQAKEARAT